MKIRRFVAKDMRSALIQIKEELGADAVIMSNKKIAEGVELMAAVDYSQSIEESRIQPKENKVGSADESATEHTMSQRSIDSDVVTLGASDNLPSNQQSSNNLPLTNPLNGSLNSSLNESTTNDSQLPSDSLSALLNRQIQSTSVNTTSSTYSNSNDQFNETNQASLQPQEESQAGSIEQQFKDFTARLQQSTDSGSITQTHSETSMNASSVDINTNKNNAQRSLHESPHENSHENELRDDLTQMQKEMSSIRQLLEHQVSGLMWQDLAQKDPKRAVLVDRLISLGLTEQIADQFAGYIPAQVNEDDAWQQTLALISQQLNTTNNDIIQRGGVVALVGPTGVGKTTTIAKLAARFSQLHCADEVALISTDTFRIGGFEQLSTYGKIIGCQVKLAKDAQALDQLLQQFSKKKLILIDTAGMGQRDMRLAEHLTTLVTNSRVRIRSYLVLAANTQQRVMQENVERFKKIPLSGSIYTKIDESVSIGEIITTSIQNGLAIGYLTDGQRVPEDIKVANSDKLVSLAEKMASKLTPQYSVAQSTVPITHSEVI